MALKIEFHTTNAAFRDMDDDTILDTYAVADAIREVANKIEDTARTEGLVLDSNGNTVGTWSLS